MVEDLGSRDMRNRRRLATEAITKGIQLDQEAVGAFAKPPR